METTETTASENGKFEDSESKVVDNTDQEGKPNELHQKTQKESKSEKNKKRKIEADDAVNETENDDENLKRTNKKQKTEEDQPVNRNTRDDMNLKRKNKKRQKRDKDELADGNKKDENLKKTKKKRKAESDGANMSNKGEVDGGNKKIELEGNEIKEKENRMEQNVKMGKKMNLKNMENIGVYLFCLPQSPHS